MFLLHKFLREFFGVCLPSPPQQIESMPYYLVCQLPELIDLMCACVRVRVRVHVRACVCVLLWSHLCLSSCLCCSNLKPWLIEVNTAPDMSASSPLDKTIKGAVFTDTYTLVGIPLCKRTRATEVLHIVTPSMQLFCLPALPHRCNHSASLPCLNVAITLHPCFASVHPST